jgi:hypothetical protein
MSHTLTHPTAGAGGTPVALQLPPDLMWPDEFAWAQVQQAQAYTTTGALLLDHWAKQAGRTITLRGGVDYAWCQRTDLATLNAWAAVPGLALQLSLRGTTRNVVFDHGQNGPIEATPVIEYSDPQGTDPYTLTLKFIQI